MQGEKVDVVNDKHNKKESDFLLIGFFLLHKIIKQLKRATDANASNKAADMYITCAILVAWIAGINTVYIYFFDVVISEQIKE